MKKTIFGFIFAAMFSFAVCGCGNNATEATTEAEDTTAVVTVDSLAADTVAVDTVAVDSAVVDTTVVEAE